MDFLKEIVKEIGDDYTQLAADINEQEDSSTQVRTSLTDWLAVPFLVAYLAIRLLPSLVSLVLVKLSSPSQLSRTFWIIILTVTVSISILKLLLIKDYLSLVV